LTVTEMPDDVVWLPLNSPGSAVHRQLGVTPGAAVEIRADDDAERSDAEEPRK
jgi:NADH-quinone oxidoreductase subunit G